MDKDLTHYNYYLKRILRECSYFIEFIEELKWREKHKACQAFNRYFL